MLWLKKKPEDELKSASEERMKLFDNMPQYWRDYANEHGLNKTIQKYGSVKRDGD